MTSQEDILSTLNQHATELRNSFSVNRIGLFGSFASGHANEKSDVDILVDLDRPSFDHYMDLKFYLERLFGRSVDLVLSDTLKPRLRPIIQQEVIYAQGL
jgi:predicted nucleotidyltransferase